ncbi:hypothetical protein BLOT_000181 [Blomia tropicalis]|nr:hypothetical protein BLOT_000181 [Blomia tropicalis]
MKEIYFARQLTKVEIEFPNVYFIPRVEACSLTFTANLLKEVFIFRLYNFHFSYTFVYILCLKFSNICYLNLAVGQIDFYFIILTIYIDSVGPLFLPFHWDHSTQTSRLDYCALALAHVLITINPLTDN